MGDLHQRLKTLLFLVPYVYRNGGVELQDLASRLGVSKKELFKEFDFLMFVGRPPFSPDDLVDIRVDEGKVYVDLPSSLNVPPRFTEFEALALACAAQLFTNDAQMGEAATAVKFALEKIITCLPDETREVFSQLAERYLVMSSNPSSAHMSILRSALSDRLEVDIKYYSASTDVVTDRSVCPYGLLHRVGVWYLVAYCNLREGIRIFRLSRITDAVLSDRIFDPPDDFDASAWLDENLKFPEEGENEIVIRFSSEDARWIKERWNEQYLEPLPDNGLRARLWDVSDEWVLALVASFAGRAIIEKPERLAKKLADQAGSALELYKKQ